MDRKQNLFRLSVLLLALFITLLTIPGFGCSKRGKRRSTTETNGGGWTRLNAPSNLNAIVVSTNQIELFWQDNSNNEDGFEIQRKIGLSGIYTQLATTTANPYSDTNNVANGLTYFYIVRAFNTMGDTSDWTEASVSIAVRTNIYAISAGYAHALALTTNEMVWSWGANYYGQLGFTDYSDRTQPTLISYDFNYDPFDSVTKIVAGGDDTGGYFLDYSLSRKTDGTIWVWGYNNDGQLGLGDTGGLDAPLQITDTDWFLISAGGYHTAAIKTNGTLWAWGQNYGYYSSYFYYGQLGLGDSTGRWTASAVGTDSDWSIVAGGKCHTMGLKTGNTLWSWGANYYGQLGLGDTISRWTPTQVGSVSDWIEIVAGHSHTIGRKNTGTLWGWGYNYNGELGEQAFTYRITPRQIGTDTDWSMAAVGKSHTMGIRTDGTLWIWGGNNYGQLGLGDTVTRWTPIQVGTQIDWSIIKAGGLYSLGLKTNGTLWAWGQNDSGQLGVADAINRNTPTQVIFDAPSPSDSLRADIVSSTQINLSWTDNSNNEEGFKITRKLDYSGIYEEIATVGINITSWSDIIPTGLIPGIYYYYRVRAFNDFGNSSYPEVKVMLSGNWAKISCGEEHTFGIKNTGTLWVWGWNGFAQLGLGGGPNRLMPTQLYTDTDWSSVTAGRGHTIALKNNGTRWGWGYAQDGELGDGSTVYNRSTPYKTDMDTDWAKVTASYWSAFGIKTTGTLWAWGWNGNGELGLGDSGNDTYRITPTLLNMETDWLDVAGGNRYTIGRRAFMGLPGSQAGTLWAWGLNGYGQLGLGDNINRIRPNQIGGIPNPHPGLTATLISLTQVDLTWSDNDNENGFQILRSVTDTPYSLLATFSSNVTSYSDTTVITTTYSYWVGAVNNFGESFSLPIILEVTDTNIGISVIEPSFPTSSLNSDWVEIAAGFNHTLGRRATGTIWSWGSNYYGQLGLGDSSYWDDTDPENWIYNDYDRNTPTQIGTDSDWVEITANFSYHSLSRKTNGTLWAWGQNDYGQLGLGDIATNRNTPTQIGTNTDWLKIATGGSHSIGLKANSTLWAWGNNIYGQLGLGDILDRSVPTLVGE